MRTESVIILLCLLVTTESACVLPNNLWSTSGIDTWYDSHKGTLNITSTTIVGWQVWTIGAYTFTCEKTDNTYYVLRSEEFSYLGLKLEAFLCFQFTEQASSKFTYYLPTTELSDAGNERIKIYLKDDNKVVSTLTDFCDATSATNLTQHIMVEEGKIDDAKITCPTELQSSWNYTYDAGSGNVCGDAYLDVCTDKNLLDFDYSKCSQVQAYSTDGELYCLHSYTTGSYTNLYVYNKDSSTNEQSTYRFTCYMYSSDSGAVYLSQSPQDCPPNGNSTYAASDGALLVLSLLSTCPTSTTYSATVEIVLGILAFLVVLAIVLALIYYCHKRKLRLAEEARKAKEEQEERERKEREEKERIRMEQGALTPTLDLGLPDDSVYDITRLFYDDEEPVTPTKVEPDMNERLLDHHNEALKHDDFMDEYKLRQMMDSEEWIDARRRKEGVDELEVAEPRTKSAVQRLKELAREKIKKGKNKLGLKNDASVDDKSAENKKEGPQIIPDLIDTDFESDEYDFMSQAGWKKRATVLDLDGEWESKKKKRRKKKKKKSNSSTYGDLKINKIPLRRVMRKKRIDPDLPIVEGEIHLPLYREDPKLKDLPPLQRVHRKRNQALWSDMFGDIHGGKALDLEAINRVRMSENKWKLLLEELYADKQYFDYARKSSAGRRVERDINTTSQQSLGYLYDRAKYWQEQPPIEPRSTFRSPRSANSTHR